MADGTLRAAPRAVVIEIEFMRHYDGLLFANGKRFIRSPTGLYLVSRK